MTEAQLFAAYSKADGHYAAPCACGGTITAETGTEAAVADAISSHQAEPVHLQWREWQAAVEALQRPTRRRCPCCGGGEA